MLYEIVYLGLLYFSVIRNACYNVQNAVQILVFGEICPFICGDNIVLIWNYISVIFVIMQPTLNSTFSSMSGECTKGKN